MDQILRQATIKLRAMWRYRLHGLITAWAIAVSGAIIVMAIPKKYEASARVFVNTDSILKPLMEGMTVQPDISQRVVMLSRVLLSRPNIEQLIKDAKLDDKAKTTINVHEKLVEEVTKALAITGSGRDNIYTLSFRDVNPERSRRVVELLVSKFIDSSNGGKTADTDSAKKFLNDQASAYEKKLEESESKLKDFKLRYIEVEPGQEKDFSTRLAEADQQLSQARLALLEAVNSREAIKRGLDNEQPFVGQIVGVPSEGTSLTDIDVRIDSLQRNLDSILLKYTDAHPDVASARRTITELTEQRRLVISEYKKKGISLIQGSGTGPRASEQLKYSLAQAEASTASLRARVGEYSSRYNRLRELAKLIPQIDSEYAQLNRDYEVNKKNYESLISRRESASISGDMQSVSGVADFRLVDPPRTPAFAKPDRLLLFIVTLLIALAAGLGVPYIITELRPTFYDTSSLRQATGLPVLGTVSLVASDTVRVKKRNDFKRYLTIAAGLMGAYTAIVVAGYMLPRVA